MIERKKINVRLSPELLQRLEVIKKAIGTTSRNAALSYAILNVSLPEK